MWLDNYDDIESSPSLSNAREESKEQYSERAKKAQIQLKKIQKDEKLAKWDDERLFLILSRFIRDPYYETLVADVTALLSVGVPSRAVIAFISLFYPDATYYVVDILGKKEKMNLLLSLPKYENLIDFNENTIHKDIQLWVREWIVLMELFILHESSSLLMNKKIFSMISSKHLALTERVLTDFLIFFFAMRNVKIPTEKSREYARFIIKNMSTKIQSFLQIQEKSLQELMADLELKNDDLFGI